MIKGIGMARAEQKRLKDGTVRWYARSWGPDGRERTEGSYTRKRDAERWAFECERKVAEGRYVDPVQAKITFKHYVDRYYWPTARHLELSTQASYKSTIDAHLVPFFGHLASTLVVYGLASLR